MTGCEAIINCKALIDSAAVRFTESESPRLDAEVLLTHVLGVPRAWLRAHAEDVVDAGAVRRYLALVERRAAGEPTAYLTGHREFWSLDLRVTPDVLVPRPETELLVEQALVRIPVDRACRVADLGTGSGAVALAIASERPLAEVVATDLSPGALSVARANAMRLYIANIRFIEGEWFAGFQGGDFDLIVSNPPYVAAGDPHLERGDLRFEPRNALAAGMDGLDAIGAIAAQSYARLVPGGGLLLEHGSEQGDAVRALLMDKGFSGVWTSRDHAGLERVTGGRRAP